MNLHYLKYVRTNSHCTRLQITLYGTGKMQVSLQVFLSSAFTLIFTVSFNILNKVKFAVTFPFLLTVFYRYFCINICIFYYFFINITICIFMHLHLHVELKAVRKENNIKFVNFYCYLLFWKWFIGSSSSCIEGEAQRIQSIKN